MEKVTAIIVSYMQPKLLADCIQSICNFYPGMRIIIIDGSPRGSDCHKMVRDAIMVGLTSGVCITKNIGHGPGLHMGISMAETEFVLLIDSDVVMIKGGIIEEMCGTLNKYRDAYGTGQIVDVNEQGHNVELGIPYLHPHFAMIRRSAYKSYKPLIHHGAPFLETMKERPVLISFPVENYINHLGRGTRVLDPAEFKPDKWDKI